MTYEYKTVGAPEKGKRKRGARSASDRVAAAFEDILAREAKDGWEYQRTDLLPIVERPGLFSRRQELHRAVMVFRRKLAESVQPAPVAAPVAAPAPTPNPAPAPTQLRPVREAPPLRTAPAPEAENPRREPVLTPSRDPDLQIADMVRGTERRPE